VDGVAIVQPKPAESPTGESGSAATAASADTGWSPVAAADEVPCIGLESAEQRVCARLAHQPRVRTSESGPSEPTHQFTDEELAYIGEPLKKAAAAVPARGPAQAHPERWVGMAAVGDGPDLRVQLDFYRVGDAAASGR